MRRGKNIPPGAPEPKLTIENINLTARIKNKNLIPVDN
jgi:hypothetical protein